MAQADAELAKMIARLRGIPDLVESVLPAVAAECKTVISENIAAQTGPDGEAWPPGADGQPVLVNAAAAVTAKAIGNVVLIRVEGPEARHHAGISRGRVRRPIIPTGKIPNSMVEAIKRVLDRKLRDGLKS